MKLVFLCFFCFSIPTFGQMGTLILNSSPSDAEVFVDGKPKGKTPLDLMLSVGNHKINIQKKENIYLWSNQEVLNIKNLEVNRLQLSLNKTLNVSGITLKKLDESMEFALSRFDNGLAIAKSNNSCGYINTEGNWVISPKYKSCDSFNEGVAKITTHANSTAYINKNGGIILGPFDEKEGQDYFGFSEGVALKIDRHKGYGGYDVILEYTTFDINGNQIGKLQSVESTKRNPNELYVSDISSSCKNGLFKYSKSDYNSNRIDGFLNKKLEVVVTAKYKNCSDFSDGLAQVQNSNKLYGYIDSNGNEVIPLKFNYTSPFSEGVAFIKIGDDSFYIDKYGNKAFNTTFEIKSGNQFKGGYATVTPKFNSDLTYIINKSGKIIYDLGNDFGSDCNVGYSVIGTNRIEDGYRHYLVRIAPK